MKEIYQHQKMNSARIENITVLMQEEVAKRISASMGNKHYGRLSIFMNLFSDCDIKFNLKPMSFHPSPKVNSSLINIIPLKKIRYNVNLATFEKITLFTFSQRRKMLRQSLKTLGGEKLIQEAKINGTMRPENLSTKDFCNLANAFDKLNIKN